MFGFGEHRAGVVRDRVLWGAGIVLGVLAAGTVARAVYRRMRERRHAAVGVRARLRAAIDRLWPRGAAGRVEIGRPGRRVRVTAGVTPRRA